MFYLFTINVLAEPWKFLIKAKGQEKGMMGRPTHVTNVVIGMDANDASFPVAPSMPNFTAEIKIIDPNFEESSEDIRKEGSDREDWTIDVTVGEATLLVHPSLVDPSACLADPNLKDPNSCYPDPYSWTPADSNQPDFLPELSWDSNDIANMGPDKFMQLRLGNASGTLLEDNLKTTTTYQTNESDALATGYYDDTNSRARMRYALTVWASYEDTQSVELFAGWNWVSFYVLPDDTSLESFFGDYADLIHQVKTQTRSALNKGDRWGGDDLNLMSNISKGVMFKIKAYEDFTLPVTGMRLPPDMSIDLQQNWTWIAYLPYSELSVEEVVTPIFADLHQIKSQTASKLKKSDGSLRGDLIGMEPGKGYVVKMYSPGFLTYPNP